MAFENYKTSERAEQAAYEAACEADETSQAREATDDEWLGRVLWVRRGAELVRACEDCGGTGVDPGSLREQEPCVACLGGGARIAGDVESHEHVERRRIEREARHDARRIA